MAADIAELLQRPFAPVDVEWRIGRSGKNGDRLWATALAYLTNRAIMARLDEVKGPEGWKNEFKPWAVGDKAGVLCGLSLKFEDEWVTKWDGAENTEIESIKGGISDSMKRAAVQWGIGRYLYGLDEAFCECSAEKKQGWNYAKSKEHGVFYWQTPKLPEWAVPRDNRLKQTVGDGVKAWADKLATSPTIDQINAWLPEIGELEAEEKSAVKTLISNYGKRNGWSIPKGSTAFVKGSK